MKSIDIELIKDQLILISFNQDLIKKLVDKEIQDRIKSELYPPINLWSPGSEKIIRNSIESVIRYKFDQAFNLLNDIKLVENN